MMPNMLFFHHIGKPNIICEVDILSYKIIKYGKSRERRNYSRVQTSVELPNLLEIQTGSFEWFKTEGIKELFKEISPIKDHSERL